MSLASTPSDTPRSNSSSSPEKPRGAIKGVAGLLKVPNSLEQQLLAFRRRLWTIKTFEYVSLILLGLAFAILAVFTVDRIGDAAGWFRGLLLLGWLATVAGLGYLAFRWYQRTQGLEKLAILLGRKLPSVGDSMLGVIELAKNHAEQSRSPALCQAAMQQVAHDAKDRDFLTALPSSKHRLAGSIAALLVTIVIGLLVVYPAATRNAVARLLGPFSGVERYTFTRVEALPAEWFVPHGEPVNLKLSLLPETRRQPESARVVIGNQTPIQVTRENDQYNVLLPAQIDAQKLVVTVGDTKQTIDLIPTLRPEIVSITGKVLLPEYLGRTEIVSKDARGGTLASVVGSVADVEIETSRPLSSANINKVAAKVSSERIVAEPIDVDASQVLEIDWTDEYQLAGREPFNLNVTAIDDEPPTLLVDGLPRQAVVLDSEMLKFQVRVSDDFGVRQAGIMWRGASDTGLNGSVEGERVLAAGGVDKETLELLGTFSANSYNIQPQPIELFVWAEDYLPERKRTYSPPYMLYILTPDQHAIWITEQLSKWHRQSLEVRDRELQLYETNKELRDLPEAELNLADTRQQIERQAQAEKSNG